MALTNDEADQAIAEPVRQIVLALVQGGREPRQALQDVRRVINHWEKVLDEEECQTNSGA